MEWFQNNRRSFPTNRNGVALEMKFRRQLDCLLAANFE